MVAKFNPRRPSELFTQSTYLKALRLYSAGDKRKIFAAICIQSLLGLVDLLGVALIGMVGALAFNAYTGSGSISAISKILRFLRLDGFTVQNQIFALGITATVVFILKTLFSIYFTRRILFFLSAKGAAAGNLVIRKLLNQNLLFLQERTSQDYLYSVTQGIQSITLGVVGASISLVADASSTIVLLAGIGIIQWPIALGSVVYFSIVGYLLYLFMHKKAEKLGEQTAELQIRSSNKLLEALNTHREALIRGRIEHYVRGIASDRVKLSRAAAEMFFMPNVSKYVIETGVIVGAVFVAFSQFLFGSSSHAVLALGVFVAAGVRIAPAVLRLQQGIIGIRTSLGTARPTLNLIEQLDSGKQFSNDLVFGTSANHQEFSPDIVFENISFSYPGSFSHALHKISFTTSAGQVLAIVGESGSGKTTLIDVLLGVLEPTEGKVMVSDVSPLTVINRWPGLVGYVPQNVVISDGTIKHNLALGFEESDFSDDEYLSALKLAQLDSFVENLPGKLEALVGENGAKLSGGQRQRLGIARALMTNPQLIVFDEATSALDSATEHNLSEAILNLRGNVTLVIVARRLSTIKSADTVMFMKNGNVLASGTFEEVRASISEFDSQATLLGIV